MDYYAFIALLAQAVIALFVVVDPLGNIPIFIGLTQTLNDKQKRKVYKTATIVGFVLLLIFALTGQAIFELLGITLESFEIAGGILLLIIAVRILISGSMHESVESPESLGAVPIAIPLLVGPGAITATIINLQRFELIITVLSVVIVLAITWLVLRFIDKIYKFLGTTGTLVIARVMALFIAAIAVEYIVQGVTILFKLG